MLRNLTLFEQESNEELDERLQLDKSRFLDVLHRIKGANSTHTLRSEIGTLSEQLRDSNGELRSDAINGDAVEFIWSYLREDLDQIAEAQTLERALYYLERLIKGVVEVKMSGINDINLNRWKEYEDIYTDSLWIVDKRDSSGVHTAGYWGNFIPQIPHQMMRRYTKPGDWVLDTFAGSGTTLIEAQRLGRNSLGVELQTKVGDGARQLVAAEPNLKGVVSDIVVGDSTQVDYSALLQRHNQKSVQLVMMHPPYFDIIKFSDEPRDLSNAQSVDAFLEMMGEIVDRVASVLDKGRYLALVIGDKYAKGEWIPLGFMTMNEVLKRNFMLKSIIVKNFEETTGKRNQKELWKYRALVGGFYIFKHEYIFVLKKR